MIKRVSRKAACEGCKSNVGNGEPARCANGAPRRWKPGDSFSNLLKIVTVEAANGDRKSAEAHEAGCYR